jgi:pimeloyl-ACP methyl ester carboxylesterase
MRNLWLVLLVSALLLITACRAADPPKSESPPEQKGDSKAMQPVSSGYVEVNGIKLYHEIYGAGEPVVLLHGGLMTTKEMSPLIQALSRKRKVIAVELEGHGRTVDTDRPLRFETLGDDVGALIKKLGVGKADVVGWSFGGATALRTAIQHPDDVRRLVVISNPYAHSGWYSETQAGMAQVSSKMAEQLMKTPVGIASRDWPQPERFPRFLDKMGALMAQDYDWSAEVRQLKMPVMLAFADHDAVSPKHIAEFFALLGGGLKDAGWQNTQFTNARLAIIPGYSHYNFGTAPELGASIEKFLDDSMTKPQDTGAAAASRSSP